MENQRILSFISRLILLLCQKLILLFDYCANNASSLMRMQVLGIFSFINATLTILPTPRKPSVYYTINQWHMKFVGRLEPAMLSSLHSWIVFKKTTSSFVNIIHLFLIHAFTWYAWSLLLWRSFGRAMLIRKAYPKFCAKLSMKCSKIVDGESCLDLL